MKAEMSEEPQIMLRKEQFMFSASHFLYGHDIYDRLHGHDYAVDLTITAEEKQILSFLDFNELKREVKAVISELHEKVLIPTLSEDIRTLVEEQIVEVITPKKTLKLPRSAISLLPISSTSCSELALYLHQKIKKRIKSLFGENKEVKVHLVLRETPYTSAVVKE